MSKVTLVFEDDAGSVSMTANYEGGFNHESNAHKTAFIAIKSLDDLAIAEGQIPEKSEYTVAPEKSAILLG